MQIRVFDLRMHRMINPLQVVVPPGAGGVSFVRLLPQVDTDPVEYPSVLLCTDDGIVQVLCKLSSSVSGVYYKTKILNALCCSFVLFSCRSLTVDQQLGSGAERGRPSAVPAPEHC